MKTSYITQLPLPTQIAIENELIELGLSNEDIERALNSRLCDLEDTINIQSYLENSEN